MNSQWKKIIFVQNKDLRFSLLVISLLLLACTENAYYNERQDIGNQTWSYGESYSFDVAINDTSSVYELQLIIQHSPDYRWENLYMKIQTIFPDSSSREELLNIDMASKAGQWIGKCSTKSCKLKVYLLEAFKFPMTGDYSFGFVQDTREENLEGMQSLELLLYKKPLKTQ